MDVEVASESLVLDSSVNGDEHQNYHYRKNNFDLRGGRRRRTNGFRNNSSRTPPPPPFPVNVAANPPLRPQFLNIPPNGRGLGFRPPFLPFPPFPGFLPNFPGYDPSCLPDLSLMFRPQPFPVPYMEEMGLNLNERIRKQIEYYFSDENLVKDFYLKRNMDEEGWVSIQLIAGFYRIRFLTGDVSLILEALQDSDVVEINGEKIGRAGDWRKWIQEPQSSNSS